MKRKRKFYLFETEFFPLNIHKSEDLSIWNRNSIFIPFFLLSSDFIFHLWKIVIELHDWFFFDWIRLAFFFLSFLFEIFFLFKIFFLSFLRFFFVPFIFHCQLQQPVMFSKLTLLFIIIEMLINFIRMNWY